MEDFDIKSFGEILKDGIVGTMPIEPEFLAKQKHGNLKENPRNPLQLSQEVKNELSKPLEMMNLQKFYFDLGSDRLERIYPYYHILEDSEVIHKRNMGTKTSKGSQANVDDKGKRDYGKVEHKVLFTKGSGKSYYYQEYRKNVRGKRTALKKETFRIVDDNGEVKTVEKVVGTKSGTTYVNKHYHYIERNLEDFIIPTLVETFQLKRLRNASSDIIDSQYDFLINQFNI